ncbi:hypothetical protein C8Q73DRAFT_796318 [Cubamyces lactineus]|nr:hypothetical protein C8Q73DRAFT_796318 [Cubamyces lactineus]
MSQSSLAFTFCTSSPSTLRAGFARFIAELADLPDASPTLTFHLDDADALSAYTELLEAIAPEGAVSLHVPHLRTLGPLSSILERWTEVKCVHLSLDATDGSPFSFGTRFVAPLQPEAKFPLPVMPGVELLIVSIPDRTVEMADIGALLENVAYAFPALHTVHIDQDAAGMEDCYIRFSPEPILYF